MEALPLLLTLAFSSLPMILLVLGLAIGVARLRASRAAGESGFWRAFVVLILASFLPPMWIELQNMRSAALLIPFALYIGYRWWLLLTARWRENAGGIYLGVLLTLVLPFLALLILFVQGSPERESFSAENVVGGTYRAAVIFHSEGTVVELQPRVLNLGTLLDYPSRRIASAGSVGRFASLRWKTPRRLVITVRGGEKVSYEKPSGPIEVEIRRTPDPK